mmetsp:Transcript_67747/g.147593  ORF Transcript_67747/g.147593 Transcript_67747/m.147593 type:complete len:137 (+) Transcript_67747:659-1069(+)
MSDVLTGGSCTTTPSLMLREDSSGWWTPLRQLRSSKPAAMRQSTARIAMEIDAGPAADSISKPLGFLGNVAATTNATMANTAEATIKIIDAIGTASARSLDPHLGRAVKKERMVNAKDTMVKIKVRVVKTCMRVNF